jgi:eukaryotic-like serine/threonine-protein kinase
VIALSNVLVCWSVWTPLDIGLGWYRGLSSRYVESRGTTPVDFAPEPPRRHYNFPPQFPVSLVPGTRLGGYEIVRLLGTGGMGEVYRAHDAKLGRAVAVKILPAFFTNDSDRVLRFQREAQALASLNHPHIAQIYALEGLDGGPGREPFIVMELVEGETLAERLSRGRLAMPEALPIAGQIAAALEAAHDRGLVHRDLKPENIKVKADGTVKVLDFGLARIADPDQALAPALTQSPTAVGPALTQSGIILGTAAYMSPEQARGAMVDRGADLWAFGVVLMDVIHVMVPGRR